MRIINKWTKRWQNKYKVKRLHIHKMAWYNIRSGSNLLVFYAAFICCCFVLLISVNIVETTMVFFCVLLFVIRRFQYFYNKIYFFSLSMLTQQRRWTKMVWTTTATIAHIAKENEKRARTTLSLAMIYV